MPRRLRGSLDLVDNAGVTLGRFDIDQEEFISTPPAPARIQRLATIVYPGTTVSDADLARFDVVRYHAYTSGEIANLAQIPRLRALNSAIKFLLYYHTHGQWDWQSDWTTINARELWFVHDAAGQRIKAGPGALWWLMNLGDLAFVAYQNQRILNLVGTYGFDGLWQDGPFSHVENDLALWPNYSSPIPASVISAWHAQAVAQTASTRQSLGARLYLTNTTPWVDHYIANWMDTDFLPNVDGTVMEGFAHAYWQTDVQMIGEAWWNWQQAQVQRNIDRGKSIWVMSGVAGSPTAAQIKRWQMFSFASYLLKADGKIMYSWHRPGSFFPEMNYDLGLPFGAATLSSGVWRRDFARGRVYVNSSTITTRLRDGLSLAASTGMIT